MNPPPVAPAGNPLRTYLFDLTMHGVKLGLENIRFLLDRAGNPEGAYPTVHVAGTNGKGSTLALLASILTAAGYRTGRFTSPHLIDVNERFLLGGQPVSDVALDAQIAFFRKIASDMDHSPTFFEMNTAIAFRLFAEAAVDLGLIEVGMGGRYDSTNVVTPEVTAITSIGLDHTEFLGDTLEAIAGEKAGIIKTETPVVLGDMPDGPRAVIEAEAARLGAPVLRIERDFRVACTGTRTAPRLHYTSSSLSLEDLVLPLAGRHQQSNAGTAIMLAEQLRARFPAITPETMRAGIEGAHWPCRMEKVLNQPPVYIDVAHNAAGAQTIAAAPGRWTVLLALSADKDAAGMLAALAPVAEHFILTAYSERRAMPVEGLAKLAAGLPHSVVPKLTDALDAGLGRATEDTPLLITGSIYTAGEARCVLMDRFALPPMQF